MAAISFSMSALSEVKKSLREEFPDIKSSHLTEAIASGLGFRTHAALKAELSDTNNSQYVLFDDDRFQERRREFGYSADDSFSVEMIVNAASIISTGIDDVSPYTSFREKAWRNLMVCTINEGLHRKLFSLKPGDNRWDGWTPNEQRRSSASFDFLLPNKLPAKAFLEDVGFDELAVGVIVNPKPGYGNLLHYHLPTFRIGDAMARAWLERRDGAWIQRGGLSKSSFRCRKNMLDSLVEISISPMGYSDKGRFYM